MKFAFLVHPLSEESKALLNLDEGGELHQRWGGDLTEFMAYLRETLQAQKSRPQVDRVRLIDDMPGLISASGARAHGRLYEIPMGAMEIIEDAARAVSYMEEAVDMAAEWGAEVVGLGSMTGVVGGQGTYLAERGPVAVTTGNSLTVYAAIQNLYQACAEHDIDLRKETVAVVGIPGSIATAAATILAPQCGELLLVARRSSSRALQVTKELGAELLLDIPSALSRARIILSATSTGSCIDQQDLRPGAIVIDVAVPTDVQGTESQRSDVLILSGGLSVVPQTMPRDSLFLNFHHGIIPSCLGETMVLGLEGRAECFSLGRSLDIDSIMEIGGIAESHGFDFSQFFSFGLPLDPSVMASYRKALVRRSLAKYKLADPTKSVRNNRLAELPGKSTKPSTNGNGHHENGNGNGHAHASGNGHTPGNGHAHENGNGHSNGHRENGHTHGNGNGHHAENGHGLATTNGSKNGQHTPGEKPLEHHLPSMADLARRAPLLHGRYINPVLMAIGAARGLSKTFVRGEGCEVWDAQGNRFMDFVAGFGSLNLGHNHPAIVDAVTQAMKEQAPGFVQAAVNPLSATLAERLVMLTPPGLELVFFCNSGTESVEAALKLARIATGRAGLLSCDKSYHGKSLGSLSVTSNPNYQRPFGPLLPECSSVPYGDLPALERALSTRRYAGFIVEPIQGEGGMITPPPGYLSEVQRLCRATGTLLIADEVQTGLGRTGALFAVEHEGVEPDIMTLAKSLGGGLMPIGAMITRRDLWMKAYGTLQSFALHTSTFGGGSLACAAGIATLDVLVQDRLVQNAAERGRQLEQRLVALSRRCDLVADVRGRGLLMGVEIQAMPAALVAHWKQTNEAKLTQFLIPNLDDLIGSGTGLYVMQALLQEHGIYSQVARSNQRVLRIQPPLTITAAQIDRFLEALETACTGLDYVHKTCDAIIGRSNMGHLQKGQAGSELHAARPD